MRLLLLLTLSAGCAATSCAFNVEERPIPIARLIVSPDRYDGVETITTGFLVFADGEKVLYASEGDARLGNVLNGIEIDLNPNDVLVQKLQQLNGRFVMLFATYRAPLKGTQRVAIGRFTNVSAVLSVSEWGRQGKLPFP